MKNSFVFLLLFCLVVANNISAQAQKFKNSTPFATVAGITIGELSTETLLNNVVILCSDSRYEVKYYSVAILRENGDLVMYNGNGNTLSESMKAEIKMLKPGSKIVIEEISAVSSDEKQLSLPTIELKIK